MLAVAFEIAVENVEPPNVTLQNNVQFILLINELLAFSSKSVSVLLMNTLLFCISRVHKSVFSFLYLQILVFLEVLIRPSSRKEQLITLV